MVESCHSDYDAVGVASIQYACGTIYNNVSRIDSLLVEKPQADEKYILDYAYSPITGRKERMQLRVPDPADPAGWTTVNIVDSQVRYAYDIIGRLDTITMDRRNQFPAAFDPENPTLDEQVRYCYNEVGSLKSIEYPNGQAATYGYDALNRLTDLLWSRDTIETYRYHYDVYADGQRKASTEYNAGAIAPTAQCDWSYDMLNRLKQEVFTDGSGDYIRRYSYDLSGNRKTIQDGLDAILTEYSYNQLDQLTFEDSTAGQDYSYLYDANGALEKRVHGMDLKNDPSDVYAYNLQGQLLSYTAVGEDTVAYQYDPQGIRISKTAGGLITHYTVDPYNMTGYAQVLTARTGTNRIHYVIGSDIAGQTLNTAAPAYLLYDGHGSVRQHTDASGAVIAYYSYDAYGNLLGGNPDEDGLYYTGEMFDAAMQNYYLRARYYAPATGRFTTLDTYSGNAHDPRSLHKYLYCNANPINGIDPTGNLTLTEALTVTGTISFIAGIVMGPLNSAIELKEQSYTAVYQTEGISFLSDGLKTQMDRDMLEASDPDLRGMKESFYNELGNDQRVITYQSHQAELNLLNGIKLSFQAAQVANAGLTVAGGFQNIAGSVDSWQTKVLWTKSPHPQNGWEHWSTLKWNVTNRAINNPDIKMIYTNKRISTATGGLIKLNKQPDWIEVLWNGKYRIYEIPSPYQTETELLEKAWLYRQAFGDKLEYFDIVPIGQLAQ